MSDDAINYTFKIADFTPETMPFGRLVEYYAEIKKLIGVADHIHLIDVVESSHGSMFAVEKNHESALTKRLIAINNGSAPKPSLRAHSMINSMLKEDGTSGIFGDQAGDNVIVFPGKRSDENTQIRIRDTATFTGELYHIAGRQDDARVRIITDAYGVVFCTTTKEIAKALRDFLFESVRVSGRGTWIRLENGTWDVDDFSITDYAPVKQENFRSAVDSLRNIGVNWPDDPLGDLHRLEDESGQIQ